MHVPQRRLGAGLVQLFCRDMPIPINRSTVNVRVVTQGIQDRNHVARKTDLERASHPSCCSSGLGLLGRRYELVELLPQWMVDFYSARPQHDS